MHHCTARALLLSLLLLYPIGLHSDSQDLGADGGGSANGSQSPRAGDARPFNSYLPQLMAVAGVTATGDRATDAIMQAAAASHFQGWFDKALSAYADAAATSPTNRDAYLGMAYAMQLHGCDQATRAFRTFLRLHRELGPIPRCAPSAAAQSPTTAAGRSAL